MARYLVGRSRVVWQFGWQDKVGPWRVRSDSDWAGDKRSRKSTSGGVIMLGSHCIKTWGSTQGAVALSSAEAEFYAMVEGVLRQKGLAQVAEELGIGKVEKVVELGTDSSAAKSFVGRRGLGKMRHIEVRNLWLQEEVAQGKVKVLKVHGEQNPSDLITKILSGKEIEFRLALMGLRVDGSGFPVGGGGLF